MDYLDALRKANPGQARGLSAAKIILYSTWDTKVLEVFLKGYANQKSLALEIHSNGFGSLLIDLQQFVETEDTDPLTPLIVLLDEEVFLPGLSLRSDAVVVREQLEKSLVEVDTRIHQLVSVLKKITTQRPVLLLDIISPGYPLFPVPSFTESFVATIHSRLHLALSEFSGAHNLHVKILDRSQIWFDLSQSQVLDDRLLFTGGWPFSTLATSRLADVITNILFNPPDLRKLLITDADQTLWQGIVGDDGEDKLSWVQEAATYRFFIYQKTLNLLISEGVLVALVSKNSVESIESALDRPDLVLKKTGLVDKCVSWSPKSKMIAQVLSKTNLLPSAVVFVDDSEFELGEVKAAFPEIKCLKFPDDNSTLRLFLQNLRSSFDTRVITDEDRIRTDSIKHAINFHQESQQAVSLEQYLASLGMCAKMEPIDLNQSERAFQLVNKTNQFNLSGRRFDLMEWRKFLSQKERIAYQLHFHDKYSHYGIVSVLLGANDGFITDWVLSCRVFGRSIEHYILCFLLKRLRRDGINALRLQFKDTGKNNLVHTFLKDHASISGDTWLVDGQRLLPTFISSL